ncbi:MAG: hypothetical protein ACREH9_04040 [Pseudomonadota bacterium]
MFAGYLVGAALMVVAALIKFAIGIKAERQPLRALPRPPFSLGD